MYDLALQILVKYPTGFSQQDFPLTITVSPTKTFK